MIVIRFIFVTITPIRVANNGENKLTSELYSPLILAKNELSTSFTNIILIQFETIDNPNIPTTVPKTTNAILISLISKKVAHHHNK